ncbi:hypothetical protein MHBO_002489 [Bonamia ostreae]|uniref:Uncharacterized protein n=1 Tax=Bonamia ostreae TaxID=126728 RepID=A0ABV2AMH2_9EUKA
MAKAVDAKDDSKNFFKEIWNVFTLFFERIKETKPLFTVGAEGCKDKDSMILVSNAVTTKKSWSFEDIENMILKEKGRNLVPTSTSEPIFKIIKFFFRENSSIIVKLFFEAMGSSIDRMCRRD